MKSMALKSYIPGISSILIFAISAIVPPKFESEPNFADDIAPIIKSKCLPCHQSGGIGPFDFTTARNFNRHIDLIRFQILSRNMPPTRVASDFGPITLTPPLTDQEIVTFQKYENAKLPEGTPLTDPIQRTLAPAPLNPNWQMIPEDDRPVRAEGTPYWRVHVFPELKQSANLRGLSISPHAPRVLRSAQFALLAPGQTPPPTDLEPNVFLDWPGLTMLGSWAPGYPDWMLPENTSKTLPKGSRLIVITKYQPSGREEDSLFELKLKATKTAAPNELETITFQKPTFTIKPDESPIFTLGKRLTQPAEIVGLIPQARFYCGLVDAELQINDSNVQNLLKIYKWDPFWIGNYVYPKPVHVPAGADLRFNFTYFNDDKCEMNENKNPETIVSGPRLTDEVCRMHVLISRPRR
jgi:hypothetical protein